MPLGPKYMPKYMFEPLYSKSYYKVTHPSSIPIEVGLITSEFLWNPIVKKLFTKLSLI
jgi:hypothetical protein